MKKTIVTVVIEFEKQDHETVQHIVHDMVFKKLKPNEDYNVADIEDIEE